MPDRRVQSDPFEQRSLQQSRREAQVQIWRRAEVSGAQKTFAAGLTEGGERVLTARFGVCQERDVYDIRVNNAKVTPAPRVRNLRCTYHLT